MILRWFLKLFPCSKTLTDGRSVWGTFGATHHGGWEHSILWAFSCGPLGDSTSTESLILSGHTTRPWWHRKVESPGCGERGYLPVMGEELWPPKIWRKGQKIAMVRRGIWVSHLKYSVSLGPCNSTKAKIVEHVSKKGWPIIKRKYYV